MMKQRIIILFYVALVMSTVWGFNPAYIGKIIAINGTVMIDKMRSGDYIKAKLEDQINLYTKIRTGSDGFATLIVEGKTIIINPDSEISGTDLFSDFRLPWLAEMKEKADEMIQSSINILFPKEKREPSGIREYNVDPNPFDDIFWQEDNGEEEEKVGAEAKTEKESETDKDEVNQETSEKEKSEYTELIELYSDLHDSSWYKSIISRDYDTALKQMNELTDLPMPWSDFMLIKGFCHFQKNRYLDAVSYYSYVMEHIDENKINWEKKSAFYMPFLCQKSVLDFITGEVTQSIRTMKIVLENAGDSYMRNYAREFMKMMYTREGM